MMQRVLKLVYIDSEIYWLTILAYYIKECTCILVEINAFKKEKTDFLTTHPILALLRQAHFQTISNGKSTAFFQMYWYSFVDHINTWQYRSGSSVAAYAEFIFERNVGLLPKMFNKRLVVNFGVCFPPWPIMPICQQVRFTHSHNIQNASWVKGGTGSAKRKWLVTLKCSFTIYEKEDIRLFLSINCINVCICGYNCCQTLHVLT